MTWAGAPRSTSLCQRPTGGTWTEEWRQTGARDDAPRCFACGIREIKTIPIPVTMQSSVELLMKIFASLNSMNYFILAVKKNKIMGRFQLICQKLCRHFIFFIISIFFQAFTNKVSQTFSERNNLVEFYAHTSSEVLSKFTLVLEGICCETVGFSSFRRRTPLSMYTSPLFTSFHIWKSFLFLKGAAQSWITIVSEPSDIWDRQRGASKGWTHFWAPFRRHTDGETTKKLLNSQNSCFTCLDFCRFWVSYT